MYRILIPISIMLINTGVAFADDEFTRKMNQAKIFILGALQVAAIINLGFSIHKAGSAKGSDVDIAEKYRTNAIVGFIGVTCVNIFVGLWNSW